MAYGGEKEQQKAFVAALSVVWFELEGSRLRVLPNFCILNLCRETSHALNNPERQT